MADGRGFAVTQSVAGIYALAADAVIGVEDRIVLIPDVGRITIGVVVMNGAKARRVGLGSEVAVGVVVVRRSVGGSIHGFLRAAQPPVAIVEVLFQIPGKGGDLAELSGAISVAVVLVGGGPLGCLTEGIAPCQIVGKGAGLIVGVGLGGELAQCVVGVGGRPRVGVCEARLSPVFVELAAAQRYATLGHGQQVALAVVGVGERTAQVGGLHHLPAGVGHLGGGLSGGIDGSSREVTARVAIADVGLPKRTIAAADNSGAVVVVEVGRKGLVGFAGLVGLGSGNHVALIVVGFALGDPLALKSFDVCLHLAAQQVVPGLYVGFAGML